MSALPGLGFEVGSVDQARRVYLGVHTVGLPGGLADDHRSH
jgi:hypothetical protein